MILTGIVLYNPEEKRLKQNIDAVITQTDKLILIDNNSSNIDKIKNIILKYDANIEIIENKENMGIAFALNQILDYAYNNKYEWFLTLDQDSVVSDNLINTYSKYLAKTKIAMITCDIEDRNFKEVEQDKHEIKEIKRCITSGTLNNTKILKKIGGYDNKMFIDSVDFDICATIIENGYKIIKINYKGLLHEVGHATERRFLWKKIIIYNHSPFRTYYIIRNGIYYAKKHKDVKWYFKVFRRMIYILIYQKEKLKNLKAIIRGIKDSIKMEV